jgi:hypothetical protein
MSCDCVMSPLYGRAFSAERRERFRPHLETPAPFLFSETYMLRVTIELVPLGIESRARIIATGTIANTGTGTPTSGDYRVELRDAAGRRWRSGTITGFPRKRLLAWDLLYRALGKVVGNRNPAPDSLAFCDLQTERQQQTTQGISQ